MLLMLAIYGLAAPTAPWLVSRRKPAAILITNLDQMMPSTLDVMRTWPTARGNAPDCQ
jgi:hypothetical protein